MRHRRHWLLIAALAALFTLTGCDDDGPTAPGGSTGSETAAVLNSVEISITLFPTDTPDSSVTIGVGPDGSSPVTLAARAGRAAVPLGQFPALAIVDLTDGTVETVPLPTNSGATGIAFANDSIVYVGNPNLNTVSVVNVRSGTLGSEIPVGVFPSAITGSGDRIFVVNSELENFVPARPGRVSVIDPSTETVVETIELSGRNPQAATFGPDGRLYVLHSGDFGGANGSLSVVDPVAMQEIEHRDGFGEFPGSIAFGPDGLAYIGAFAYGVAVWDPAASTFVRPPGDPLRPQGHNSSSGLGFDSTGRLYWLAPQPDPRDPDPTVCDEPSVAVRLDPDGSVDREIPVGICPIAIAFTIVTPTTRD